MRGMAKSKKELGTDGVEISAIVSMRYRSGNPKPALSGHITEYRSAVLPCDLLPRYE